MNVSPVYLGLDTEVYFPTFTTPHAIGEITSKQVITSIGEIARMPKGLPSAFASGTTGLVRNSAARVKITLPRQLFRPSECVPCPRPQRKG